MSVNRLQALGLSGRVYHDRRDAGRQLGERLQAFAGTDTVVVGLPRGGIPVAFEVARALDAPLDLLVVRKVGAPGHPELGMGAVAEGGVRVLNEDVLRSLLVSAEELEHAVARAEAELDARARRYRGERPALDLEGRTVILVDDGLATGGSARAAARALRDRKPDRLVLAVPVGAPDSIDALGGEFDEILCLQAPETMWAIGLWYEDFGQTSDEEVAALLAQASAAAEHAIAAGTDAADPPPDAAVRQRQALIPLADGGQIIGDLVAPTDPVGVVVFAHGSGSGRHSPRNRQVAAALNDAGLATLLIDLLTVDEERHRANVFDIALLAQRLAAATHWVCEQPDLDSLALGYFGASTGAGAALWAAAQLGDQVNAVVSRGGRPDLAIPRLGDVRAATLLIVGGLDTVVIQLNRDALAQLRCEARLEIVPGATHLFEEPGTLEAVQRLAAAWFTYHLTRGGPGPQTQPRPAA
jgi:putative phosphoribosyl transferase